MRRRALAELQPHAAKLAVSRTRDNCELPNSLKVAEEALTRFSTVSFSDPTCCNCAEASLIRRQLRELHVALQESKSCILALTRSAAESSVDAETLRVRMRAGQTAARLLHSELLTAECEVTAWRIAQEQTSRREQHALAQCAAARAELADIHSRHAQQVAAMEEQIRGLHAELTEAGTGCSAVDDERHAACAAPVDQVHGARGAGRATHSGGVRSGAQRAAQAQLLRQAPPARDEGDDDLSLCNGGVRGGHGRRHGQAGAIDAGAQRSTSAPQTAKTQNERSADASTESTESSAGVSSACTDGDVNADAASEMEAAAEVNAAAGAAAGATSRADHRAGAFNCVHARQGICPNSVSGSLRQAPHSDDSGDALRAATVHISAPHLDCTRNLSDSSQHERNGCAEDCSPCEPEKNFNQGEASGKSVNINEAESAEPEVDSHREMDAGNVLAEDHASSTTSNVLSSAKCACAADSSGDDSARGAPFHRALATLQTRLTSLEAQ
eukprot:6174017-Pleurochrysis_carterae.AAC.2